MGQEEILKLFFDNPGRTFHIRGIARMLGISKTAAAYHVNNLVKEKLLMKEIKDVFPSYRASDTQDFRLRKQNNAIREIIESGLIAFLEEKTSPGCIVLFGSFAKGEYTLESDIDLFVQAEKQDLDLRKHEKKLGHKISLFFEPHPEKMSPNLLNNIINGVKLQGFLRIK